MAPRTLNPAPPLIIPPSSPTHTHTIILLHGRGSNGATFSSALLSHPITLSTTATTTLTTHLPTTKFIIPTSPFRRAVFANRARITQWFDNFSVEPERIEERPEIQIPGLRESVMYVHGLIEEAAAEVGGEENVVVMGLSLGACTAVAAGLCWLGKPMGPVVGMAGRVVLRDLLEDVMEGRDGDGDEDMVSFADEDEDNDEQQHDTNTTTTPANLAIHALLSELDLPSSLIPSTPPFLSTPIFLGHGVHDEKVPVEIGRASAACLSKMGCEVTWREYGDLGHWYHDRELGDIVEFLKGRCVGM